MDFEKWVSGCLVRVFPWIDGKNIYVNVRYFRAGQSIYEPPVWDRTVYVFDDEAGRKLINCFISSLVNAICLGEIKHNTYIKVKKLPLENKC